MLISDEKVVAIHYTLTNNEGQVLDSSEGHDPLAYIHGTESIIPGLEKALDGKTVGDTLAVVIPPEEGYGRRNEELVQTIAMSNFEDPSQVALGVRFQVQTPEATYLATVTKIVGEEVTIDMNHPLADETLHFDVDVVDIRAATEQELEHGHVHAPGGHAH